ncbi:MAG: type II secretion system secretin GspD [Neisseriaceae bacterium]
MRYLKINKILVILFAMSSFDIALARVTQELANSKMETQSKSTMQTPGKASAAQPKLGNSSSGVNKPGINKIQSNSASSSSSELNPNMVVLNFENSDIQSTIKAISQLSGKNFVIDPRVKGTVTIVSDKPIAKADSYKVLETALRMQGFAVVEGDGVIKVLPETDAKTYGMKTLSQSANVNGQIGDQIVTKIFIIQHGSATQLVNSLRPLIAPNNSISAYPNSNAVIVTDYASNINRISKIINKLSATTQVRSDPIIVQMRYAVAADVGQLLQSYLQNGGGPGGGASGGGNVDGPAVTVTVDSASNSLIIYSTVKQRMQEIKNLALQLDRNISGSNNNLHVVYLRNADAAHIADVLRVVAYNQENPDITASSTLAKFTSEPTSTFATTGSGGGGGGSAFSGTSSASNRPSTPSSTSNRGAASGGQAGAKDQPKIFIQAEPTINALIIQAPESVYRNLRMIIDMLDVRRAQIMIEALIADINANTSGTFGIQWAVGAANNQIGAVGIGNYANGNSSLSSVGTAIGGALSGAGNAGQQGAGAGVGAAAGLAALPNEMMIGLVTGTVTVGGQTIPSIGALADMLSANNMGNVLSRPTLITLDNEEAKIMVGQNIGIPNGSYQNTAAQAGQLFNTYTRTDVGTVLQVKPLITQSGAIQLDIYQEDSQVEPGTSNLDSGPSFLKRNMRSTLLVDDGQIIAIGGMTRDELAVVRRGIPLLSDIPYLGWLFSWQSRSHVKTNLVLFLRPVIIKNADGYKALTNNRYKYIIDQQNAVQAKGNLLLPKIDPVTLDNQVPYAKENIPAQPNNQVITPIVDMRSSQIKSNSTNNTVTPKIIPRGRGKALDSNDTVLSPAN